MVWCVSPPVHVGFMVWCVSPPVRVGFMVWSVSLSSRPDHAGAGHARAQLHHHQGGVQAQQAAPLRPVQPDGPRDQGLPGHRPREAGRGKLQSHTPLGVQSHTPLGVQSHTPLGVQSHAPLWVPETSYKALAVSPSGTSLSVVHVLTRSLALSLSLSLSA